MRIPPASMRSATVLAGVVVAGFLTMSVASRVATGAEKWTFVTATADKHPQLLLSGHYVDTLVRERGVWKFQRRLAYGDIPQGEPKTN
jgi:SnoaL-like domain